MAKHLILTVVILICLLPGALQAQVRISATGSCTITLTAADLRGGAGTDFKNNIRTVRGDVILEITRARTSAPFRDWEVDVHKTDGNWGSSWTTEVKLTNNGRGNGTITRDTNWHELSGIAFTLFSGSGNRSNLKPRYRIQGISVTDGTGTFTTTITYTIRRM